MLLISLVCKLYFFLCIIIIVYSFKGKKNKWKLDTPSFCDGLYYYILYICIVVYSHFEDKFYNIRVLLWFSNIFIKLRAVSYCVVQKKKRKTYVVQKILNLSLLILFLYNYTYVRKHNISIYTHTHIRMLTRVCLYVCVCVCVYI